MGARRTVGFHPWLPSDPPEAGGARHHRERHRHLPGERRRRRRRRGCRGRGRRWSAWSTPIRSASCCTRRGGRRTRRAATIRVAAEAAPVGAEVQRESGRSLIQTLSQPGSRSVVVSSVACPRRSELGSARWHRPHRPRNVYRRGTGHPDWTSLSGLRTIRMATTRSTVDLERGHQVDHTGDGDHGTDLGVDGGRSHARCRRCSGGPD